jgi:hypothetical protein
MERVNKDQYRPSRHEFWKIIGVLGEASKLSVNSQLQAGIESRLENIGDVMKQLDEAYRLRD